LRRTGLSASAELLVLLSSYVAVSHGYVWYNRTDVSICL